MSKPKPVPHRRRRIRLESVANKSLRGRVRENVHKRFYAFWERNKNELDTFDSVIDYLITLAEAVEFGKKPELPSVRSY